MSKTTNKFSPEVRERAVRMVLDHERDHPSRWAAVTSIAAKIGCTAQTLHEWVKRAEVDAGKRAGVPTDVAEMARRGFVSRIHRKKPKGKPMPERMRIANAQKSKVRSRVEHVFGYQKGPMGLVVRTVGLARARVTVGLANLAYNMRRFLWLRTKYAAA